jgi:Mrp family chromosome partitioning ATPase
VIAALKNCHLDGAVIVTTPQDLSVDMIKREINFCQKMKLPIIGVIENMYASLSSPFYLSDSEGKVFLVHVVEKLQIF